MRTKSTFQIPEQLTRSIDDVDRALATGEVDLTLDFANCTFLSVEGLEWLEELLLRASSHSAQVGLVNVVPSIYKVFKIARIDAVLKACGATTVSGPVC